MRSSVSDHFCSLRHGDCSADGLGALTSDSWCASADRTSVSGSQGHRPRPYRDEIMITLSVLEVANLCAGPSRRRILLCGISASLLMCLNPNHVAAKPGRGNCTQCHGPALSTTPADGATLDFGDVLVGTSIDKSLIVINTGGNSGGRSVRLSGDFPTSAGDFSLNGPAHFSSLRRNASENRSYTLSPSTRGPRSQAMTATADESSDGWPVLQGSSTVTFIGRGVAPVADVRTAEANVGNVRLGATASPLFTVENSGDGNLSGLGVESNLQGSVPGASGAFVGPGGSVDLIDGASMEFQYRFAPTDRGPQSTTIGLSFANGSPDGANQAHTVNLQLAGVGVGPGFDSSPKPDSVIDFGKIGSAETSTQLLLISNLTPDGDLGDQTDLTLLSAIVSGPGADQFSVDSFVPGAILGNTEALNLNLSFNSHDQTGSFQATLSITTDQGAMFGAAGDVFRYELAGLALDSGLLGDFNENGQLDVGDIDQLTAEVIAGTHNIVYDLNGDVVVDQADREIWIVDQKRTYYGDANLDGEFNSSDLVDLFTAGEYEDGVPTNSTWATGDFNGDADFDSGDLVAAFTAGGYEQGPRREMIPVPEPTSIRIMAVALIGCAIRRRYVRP